LISIFQYNYSFKSVLLILMMKHSMFLIYIVFLWYVLCVVICCMLCLSVYGLLTNFIFNGTNVFWICEMKCICMYVCVYIYIYIYIYVNPSLPSIISILYVNVTFIPNLITWGMAVSRLHSVARWLSKMHCLQ